MEKMQPYLQMTYGQNLKIGIGIHYGDVVIGDAVNFASRVESANKKLGSSLLISQTVHDELKGGVQIGKSCTVEIKGKSGEHRVYEVLSLS